MPRDTVLEETAGRGATPETTRLETPDAAQAGFETPLRGSSTREADDLRSLEAFAAMLPSLG